ncbi:MAG TPA: response regulator, partial [Terriglobales bacterium]|nr:response regulator [Terriglobales bacterium]
MMRAAVRRGAVGEVVTKRPRDQRERPTVFVVDDNAVGRESLRWLLESARIPVETYESGVAFLRQPPIGRTGCIVLDLRMRGMNGLDVEARLAKVAKARMPVIM